MAEKLRVTRPTEDTTAAEAGTLHDIPASEIKPEKTAWLWENRLEWSTTACLQGDKTTGKSTWCRAIAAHVSGGPKLPGWKGRRRDTGNVLYYAGEESLKTRVTPGLIAAGAKLERVFCADCYAEDPSEQLHLPGDCDRLTDRVRFRNAKLVVIDPIFCFTDGSCDLEGPTIPARQFMRALHGVAKSTGCLILWSRNLTKCRALGALAAGRGSAELANVSRSVLHLQEFPNAPKTYALAVAACNNGGPVPALTYTLQPTKAGAVKIRCHGEDDITADELCAGEDGQLERCLLDRAKQLIRGMVTGGKLDSRIVKAKAEAAMIGLRTLQQAAKTLGVVIDREGLRENLISYWSAPKGGYPL